jgi:ribonuclease P protein component
MREAHVPAEQQKAQEATRVPVAYAIPRRSGGAQGPTPARPHAPVGLIWRVRDRATFAALARAERHVQGPITVRVVPAKAEGPARVAYAVRGAGNAVARNRLRRRLRAAVGRTEADLLAGGAYLVSARREALTMPFDALVGTLAALFAAARSQQ